MSSLREGTSMKASALEQFLKDTEGLYIKLKVKQASLV